MEPTKEHPYGRCEKCGRDGSAYDDLVTKSRVACAGRAGNSSAAPSERRGGKKRLHAPAVSWAEAHLPRRR